jgi:hypothetical protein
LETPASPPPGFSIWRALRFTVRPRLARVAAGPPGMDQAGAHPGARRQYTCRQDRSVPYRVEHCRSAPNPRRRNYFQHEVIKNTKITCAFIRSDDRRRAAIAAREQPACDEILSRSLPWRSYNELTFVKACCHVSAHVRRVPHRHQRPGAPTEKQNGRNLRLVTACGRDRTLIATFRP